MKNPTYGNTTNETIAADIESTRQALASYVAGLPEWDGVDRFVGQLAPLADLYADLANADDPNRDRAEPVAVLGSHGTGKSLLLRAILPREVAAPFETNWIPAQGTPDALYAPREATSAVVSPLLVLDWTTGKNRTTAGFAAAAAHGREGSVTFRAPYARAGATEQRPYTLVVLAEPDSEQDARRAGFTVVRLTERQGADVLSRRHQDQMLAQKRRGAELPAGAAETSTELRAAKPTDKPSYFMDKLLRENVPPAHGVLATVGFPHYDDWIELEFTDSISEDDTYGLIHEIADKLTVVASRVVGQMIAAPVQMRVQAYHRRFLIDTWSWALPTDVLRAMEDWCELEAGLDD